MVESSLRLRKRIQIQVPLGSTGSAPVPMGAIMAGVPGGATYWNTFRIDSVLIWGSDILGSDADNNIKVTLSASSAWSQPNFQLLDNGTVGSERPKVGFRLGVLDRARWLNTASSELLCIITGPADTSATLQASIELISQSFAA